MCHNGLSCPNRYPSGHIVTELTGTVQLFRSHQRWSSVSIAVLQVRVTLLSSFANGMVDQIELDTSWRPNTRELHSHQFKYIMGSQEQCEQMLEYMKEEPKFYFEGIIKMDVAVEEKKTEVRTLRVHATSVDSAQMIAHMRNMPGVIGNNR